MTVSTTASSQTFAGNGIATSFPCDFMIVLQTDITVTFVNPSTGVQTSAVLNTDYTVTGAGNATGFTITTTIPVPTGTNLLVQRTLPYNQPVDFTNQGAFFPTMHQNMADRLEMQIQQIATQNGLNMSMPAGLVPAPSTALPIPLAGSLLGWNASGNALVNVGTSGLGAGNVSDVNVSAVAGIQASKLAFEQAETGAVGRTVQSKLADAMSVIDFGAKCDGVKDDSAAFAAAYAAASAGSFILVPGPTANVVTPPTGTKSVIWKCEATLPGGNPISLPGIIDSVVGTRRFIANMSASPTDIATIEVQRRPNFTGGTAGFVNACITANNYPAAGDATFEFGICGICTSSATGGENGGVYGQGNRQTSTSGPIWGMVAESNDYSGAADPATGQIGIEVDVFANGTDAHNNRIGVAVFAGNTNHPGANCQASYGVLVTSERSSGYTGSWKTGYGLGGPVGIGFDASAASLSASAFKMASGQRIAFTGGEDRILLWYANTLQYQNVTTSSTVFSIGDGGNVNITGTFSIIGTQVVTSRRTGWSTPTGTVSRATFDTGSATTAQLAQALAALIDDLTSHGLIGT